MDRPTFTIRLTGFAIAAACLASACGSQPSASAPVDATATPATATASPVAASADPSTTVALTTASGHRVSVDIDDASGLLANATTGTPGDGASVEPYRVIVTNDDPSTLRLTWSGGPCDLSDSLAIDATGRRFLLVEPECAGDAVAFDRVLLLHLSSPIDATEVDAVLQDGLDTDG